MNSIILIFTILALAIMVVLLICICVCFIPQKRENEKELHLIEHFNNSSEPGADFVKLLETGYFKSVKTGNHGNCFPDQKNLSFFKSSLNSRAADILDKLGDIHESSNL